MNIFDQSIFYISFNCLSFLSLLIELQFLSSLTCPLHHFELFWTLGVELSDCVLCSFLFCFVEKRRRSVMVELIVRSVESHWHILSWNYSRNQIAEEVIRYLSGIMLKQTNMIECVCVKGRKY